MTHSASYLHAEAIRVFILFAGLAFISGMLATYLVQRIGSPPPGVANGVSDVVKFGGPVAGFAVAILISNYLGWLAVRATAWQYLKAAVVAIIAMPAAFVVFIGLSVVVAYSLARLVPSITNGHPLYVAGAYLTLGSASSLFPLLTGYSLRTITGVWDWWLLGAMYVAMWFALLAPSPWDRPFVSVVGGLIGLWLTRSPAAS